MMRELDALDPHEAEFLTRIANLPGSYDGPDGTRPEPYGLMAFGEAATLPALLRPWVDGPLVASGTQFLLAPGFDFGEFEPVRVASGLTSAQVVTLGTRLVGPDIEVPNSALSLYTYACYLGYATGHHDAVAQLDRAMTEVASRCRGEVPTEINPAKAMAWTLWNRVPLLVAASPRSAVPALIQRVFARVGKSLAVAVGEHPLEMVTGAFEGKHALGDDVLALLTGPDDVELGLVREVLATRVAQVESLDVRELVGDDTPADPVALGLSHWYLALFVAAYMAILNGHDPADSPVYEESKSAVSSF
jgi:hypothetical protein